MGISIVVFNVSLDDLQWPGAKANRHHLHA